MCCLKIIAFTEAQLRSKGLLSTVELSTVELCTIYDLLALVEKWHTVIYNNMRIFLFNQTSMNFSVNCKYPDHILFLVINFITYFKFCDVIHDIYALPAKMNLPFKV